MKKSFKKITFIIFSMLITLSLQACNRSTKVNSNLNTSKIQSENKEINKFINEGDSFISSGDYKNAMKSYMNAISIDKTNKDLYIMLKDMYIDLYRFDDAFLIVKTAINNDVDVENMKSILSDISSKFDIINLSNSIYQDEEYSLPTNIDYTIDNNICTLLIKWNIAVDTSVLGEYVYEGYNEDFGRTIKMTLSILPNSFDKQIGYITDIYKENGNIYVAVDLIEFYTGDEAVNQAIKDNKANIDKYGDPFVYEGYYIRNKYDTITTYQVSDNCSFELLEYDFTPYLYTSSEKKNVDYETFYKKIEEIKRNDSLPLLLCWIETKNGVSSSIYRESLLNYN